LKPISTSTIRSTASSRKNGLSAEDICRIIETCKLSGLKNLRFETDGQLFSAEFHSQGPASPELGQVSEPQYVEVGRNQNLARPMSDDTLDEAEEAQTLIDDPAMFEKMQIDRHIERERLMNDEGI
jgi:hypothetical protein